MKARYAILVGVVCLVAVGLGIFLIPKTYGGGQMAAVAVSDGSTSTASTASTSAAPADIPVSSSTPETKPAPNNMRQYANDTFHFSLLYPDALQATEYKEAGGALTVTFADNANGQSFEVYVTPYANKSIDQTRFRLDEPSGTFLKPTDVVIDGSRGTMFFGKNPIMGDTREVWFIRSGFLYEVTTYKELDTWLAGIMQTWKFI